MPHDLLQALQARGLRPRVVSHPYTAMAGVLSCQLSRPQEMGEQPVVLVAVQPDKLARIDQLFACLDRFAPRVARWSYDASAQPPLQAAQLRPKPVVVQTDHKDRPEEVDERLSSTQKQDAGSSLTAADGLLHGSVSRDSLRDRQHSGGPMLRLAGLGSELKPLRSEEEEASSILTREEMAALLSDEPGGGGVRGL